MMGDFFFLFTMYGVLMFLVAFVLIVLYLKSKEQPLRPPYAPPLPQIPLMNEKEILKRKLLFFAKILYSAIMLLGFAVAIAGLFIINSTGNAGVLIFGAVEIFAGMLIVFLSFRSYRLHLRHLWDDVIPKIIGP